jgi:hypothetical protein
MKEREQKMFFTSVSLHLKKNKKQKILEERRNQANEEKDF